MNKLTRLREFVAVYFEESTQHATYRAAREWMEMGVTASDAARWANAGYLPGEAAPLIAQGVTPDTAEEMDQLAVDLAGGSELRAMEVVDGLVRDGLIVDPARVRQMQDPHDPTHIIVTVDPD